MNIITAGTRKITIPNFGPVVPARPRGGAAAESSLLTDLVAYWKLDEESDGSGAVTRNDSAGSNHLTDNNTTASATGIISNGADFEKDNSEYLSVADNAELSLGDIDFTVALWCKLESELAAQFITSKDTTGAGNREFLIASLTSGGDGFQISVFRATDSEVNIKAAMTINVDTWYFVVGWHDAAADKIYIQVNNGTPVEKATGGPLQSSGAAPFAIGARGNGTNNFDGVVDEVGLWKRVLTTDERTTLYNSGSGATYPDF